MNTFLLQYLETAIWASTDDERSIHDFAPEAIELAEKDCRHFQTENADLIKQAKNLEQVARDFWLTRNGHGAGFWDGDYEYDLGQALTKSAHDYGSCDIYIGDDGKLYLA